VLSARPLDHDGDFGLTVGSYTITAAQGTLFAQNYTSPSSTRANHRAGLEHDGGTSGEGSLYQTQATT